MYQLKNDQLTIVATDNGAMLTSIQSADGLEYLWQGDPVHWAGQAPICFPICGGLRNGRAMTKTQKSIVLGRHGFARNSQFDLMEQEVDRLLFRLQSNSETLCVFPFPFILEIQYCLVEDSVAVTYAVTNPGKEILPFFIGGHPAFNCPIEDSLDFSDYAVQFDQEIARQTLANCEGGLLSAENLVQLEFDGRHLPLKQALFKNGALVFDQIASKSVTLTSSKGTHGLELTYPDFKNLLIWSSGTNAPFVALEPWNGLATLIEESDIFEEKRDLQLALPGETKAYTYCMRFF
ncbi:aldose 1-epimerase family protein [Streptococcus ovuberis]|uniref:Aldose 1-epimerase family protein n=1 Tax=Streptococcus ovuberis TaxID=1936207 RepID=A0A7X6N0R7_9STRE|nr:aldose 1-epimerase family protein [Streptococcus ovuberis]NKZ21411.1 aldose 1-epimerase family protein [Streptococcus ovuberis]